MKIRQSERLPDLPKTLGEVRRWRRYVLVMDRLTAIASESEKLALVAEEGPPDAQVPSCPGWTMRDLVGHLGEVQHAWAANIRARDTSRPTRPDAEPLPGDDLGAFLRTATADLLDALGDADDADPCWTWWGSPATAGAVARHQVQEAAVHRWDGENSVGSATPLPLDIAVDGVAEFLEIMAGGAGPPEGALRLAATDVHASWLAGTGEPVATISATASDLVLVLYRRLGLDSPDVEVTGDRDVAEAALRSTSTE